MKNSPYIDFLTSPQLCLYNYATALVALPMEASSRNGKEWENLCENHKSESIC